MSCVRAPGWLQRGGLRWLAWLAWLALFSTSASAHTRSESFMLVEVSPAGVHVNLTLPDSEVARLALSASALASPISDAQLGAYVEHNVVVSADGHACPGSGARPLIATRGFRRIEMQFTCPVGAPLTLRSDAFFDLVPSHLTFARISLNRDGQRSLSEHLIGTGKRTVTLGGAAASDLERATFFDYVALGIEHILTGPDHLAFVLGFVLISRRWRDLALVITGFTLGHSVTLALAVTGVLQPHPGMIDILIALTIGLIGAENFVVATHRPRVIASATAILLLAMGALKLAGFGVLPLPLLAGLALFAFCYLMMSGQLQDGGKLRLVITLIFGLIHGFAFARDLIELKLPAGRLAELLFGFNAGVEVGQLMVVTLLILFARLMTRLHMAPARALVIDLCSSALVGLGVFWLISRTYA